MKKRQIENRIRALRFEHEEMTLSEVERSAPTPRGLPIAGLTALQALRAEVRTACRAA